MERVLCRLKVPNPTAEFSLQFTYLKSLREQTPILFVVVLNLFNLVMTLNRFQNPTWSIVI